MWQLHELAFGFVTILTALFLAEAFGVVRVDAFLLVAIGLFEHAALFKAKGLDGLALRWVRRNFASGAVVYRPFRLASRAGFYDSA